MRRGLEPIVLLCPAFVVSGPRPPARRPARKTSLVLPVARHRPSRPPKLLSFLVTTCNGEDHGPFDLRMMPDVAISAKFAFAAASFCGHSGRAFARIGCPRVSIVWRTSCLGQSILKFGTVTDGNSAITWSMATGLLLW